MGGEQAGDELGSEDFCLYLRTVIMDMLNSVYGVQSSHSGYFERTVTFVDKKCGWHAEIAKHAFSKVIARE
jgi:hypothetical protein